jgi:pimeloyl-ACP methyl ester carboxylesterase
MTNFSVYGSTVSVRDEGKGEPVVYLHGSIGQKNQWGEAYSQLADGFRFVAPDLIGYGNTSNWDAPRSMSLADEARNVAALINDIGQPVHLVGHSYGGAVALHLALHSPLLVDSLTLIEPVAFNVLNSTDAEANGCLQEVRNLANDAIVFWHKGEKEHAARRFVDYWNKPGAFDQLPTLHQQKIQSQMGKVAADFKAIFAETWSLEDYKSIQHPTRIMCGTRSPQPVRLISRLIASVLDNARGCSEFRVTGIV